MLSVSWSCQSVRPARLTTASMGTWAHGHFIARHISIATRSALNVFLVSPALSGVRYKNPSKPGKHLRGSKVGKSGGSGLGRARSCSLSPLEETREIGDDHGRLAESWHHVGIILGMCARQSVFSCV
jgi:hypothetical protein